MADDEQLSETLLDLFVYAPIGLALDAKELIPKLAERGRGQVALARLAAPVVARQAGDDPKAALDSVAGIVRSFVADLVPGDPTDGSETEVAAEEPVTDTEPVPGYDSMTAAEIVPTLAGRSRDERDRIEQYEATHRGRRTILNRLQQLQN